MSEHRRPRGDHLLRWDESRQRWKARATVGYDARGKRIYVTRFAKSQSAAIRSLRQALREREQGANRKADRYTVEQAVTDWLAFGLSGRAPNTVKSFESVAKIHVIPHLGGAKLKDLTVRDVEKWLHELAPKVGRSTLVKARMVLGRSIRRAIAHELAVRNVADYCELPEGRPGRPSKSFTAAQADAILKQTRDHRMHAYIVVSMLTGARTEEMRELTWDHVVLETRNGVPPHMVVWRSVRRGGETKTRKSRRTIALPRLCIDALMVQRMRQEEERRRVGDLWRDGRAYVFTTTLGDQLDVNNVRRDFRVALKAVDGINSVEWTPRELRHSFVSLLSDAGVPLEAISRLVGHSGSMVTELVYRHQIRPVVQTGAEVMDEIFAPANRDQSGPWALAGTSDASKGVASPEDGE